MVILHAPVTVLFLQDGGFLIKERVEFVINLWDMSEASLDGVVSYRLASSALTSDFCRNVLVSLNSYNYTRHVCNCKSHLILMMCVFAHVCVCGRTWAWVHAQYYEAVIAAIDFD